MDIFDIFRIIISVLNPVFNILFVFIFVAFFYGIGLFILNVDRTTKNTKGEKLFTDTRMQGKQWMFWSIIALFVAISLWGLMGFLQSSFSIQSVIIPPMGVPT
ncbi:hypothetical protein L0Y46_04295 [bacterium]|nr:hypothetical protein [bacterium]